MVFAGDQKIQLIESSTLIMVFENGGTLPSTKTCTELTNQWWLAIVYLLLL